MTGFVNQTMFMTGFLSIVYDPCVKPFYLTWGPTFCHYYRNDHVNSVSAVELDPMLLASIKPFVRFCNSRSSGQRPSCASSDAVPADLVCLAVAVTLSVIPYPQSMRFHLVATCDFLARIAKPEGETAFYLSRLVLLQSLSARLAFELPAGASSLSLDRKCLMFRFCEAYQRFSACSPLLLELMAPFTQTSANMRALNES